MQTTFSKLSTKFPNYTRSVNYVSQIIVPASVPLLFCQWEILKGDLKKREGGKYFLSVSNSCQYYIHSRVSCRASRHFEHLRWQLCFSPWRYLCQLTTFASTESPIPALWCPIEVWMWFRKHYTSIVHSENKLLFQVSRFWISYLFLSFNTTSESCSL